MIYSNKDVSIEKQNDNYIINCNNPILLESFGDVLAGLSSSKDGKTLIARAKSIQTLAQLLTHHKYGLDYSTVNAMIVSLAKQITFLERNKYGIVHFSLHDIIVVNDSRFFFANSSLVSPIYNGRMDILRPLKPNKFMSPETLLIKELPATLDYRSSYYSLGVISAYVLLKVNINYKKLDPELDPIIATPLYWGIKRSVIKDPNSRFLLYI
jgi:hypothetical protein